ncbi:hypothetical protein AMTRI_Chr06g169130 [Amborella trichopoda]
MSGNSNPNPNSSSIEKGMSSSTSVIESVNELQSLSSALSNFTARWNELHTHLNSIHKAIDSRLTTTNSNTKNKNPNSTADGEEKNSKNDGKEELLQSSFEALCKQMDGKALRRFVTINLSQIDSIRKMAPGALMSAPDPAKLILDCMGGFYLQHVNAFSKHSPLIGIRRACILLLEFFVASSLEVSSVVQEEAKSVSIAWRERLIKEGGVAKATGMDALGLLLFVAAFGVPPQLENEDLYHLMRLVNLRKRALVLRCSPRFMKKLPDVIEGLISRGNQVAAVDLAYTFGLQDKFKPLPLLKAFLEDARKGKKKQAPPDAEWIGRLAALNSVIKCAKDHKFEAAISGWNLNAEVAKLEKEKPKRKVDKIEKRKADKIEKPKLGVVKKRSRPSMVLPKTASGHVVLPSNDRGIGAKSARLTMGVFDAHQLASSTDGFVTMGNGTGLGTSGSMGFLVGGGMGSYGWQAEGLYSRNNDNMGQNVLMPTTYPSSLPGVNLSGSNLYSSSDPHLENVSYYGGYSHLDNSIAAYQPSC